MKKSRRQSPKSVLRLPDLQHAKSAVLNSLTSLESRRSYEFAIQNTAMELMQAGVDRTLIALWLGHESVETTQIYLDANLRIKRGGPFQNHADQHHGGPLSARR
ncbi:MAG TPA: hypothetical protein VIY49_10510 [Bryobacteraceae bacterium]